MKLFLVRHGETERNREGRVMGQGDQCLTTEGRRQAVAVARALAKESITVIYSSPLVRAIETATVVGEKLGLPVQEREELAEMDVGELDGLTSEEMRARYPDLMEQWDNDPSTVLMPGGDSLAHVQEQAWNLVEAMLRDHPQDNIVAVSHNFPIGSLVCKALDLPLAAIRRLRVQLGSISIVEFHDGHGRLVLLNDTCHLAQIVSH